ncbi:MAG: MFS transporter [Ruminococcaceae bacterium]|nr:MFS transporter [Oscillospiraceae bacterium]
MAVKCPSCGGKMAFQVPTQSLKCSYCESDMQIEDYTLSNEAEVSKDTYTVTIYGCPDCGAELSAPDDQTVAYCSYCGGESNLTMKQEEAVKPARIIPFKISKENAVKTYEDALKTRIYVPKELKEGRHINDFRGIYIPYLSYEVDIPENALRLNATKKYTKGNWDYHEEYVIDTAVGGTVKGMSFDASAMFDDSIAREISPFNTSEQRDFNEAYIAGFYSDKLTTPPETYADTVEETAVEAFYSDIGERAGGVKVTAPRDYQEKKMLTGISGFRYKVDLFPVWFLTWKNKNRVAYSVMNGQTGKLSMDIPVDKKAFFRVSGIMTAVLFLILSFIPMFILPKTISLIAAVFLIISSIVLSSEIKKIYYRENHIFDVGNVHFNKDKQVRKKPVSAGRKNPMRRVSAFLFLVVLVFIFVKMDFPFYIIGNIITSPVYAIALFIQIILLILMLGRISKIEKKTAFIPMLIGILALGTGLIIWVFNPAYDYWYYGLAILCFLAMLGNMISMINYLNYLTTRPVPDFFRREGADHGK